MNLSFFSRSIALIVSVFTVASVSSLFGAEVLVDGVGVVQDASEVGAVRIDPLNQSQTASASYRQVPFAVAPDALRKFTANGLEITEIGINESMVFEVGPYLAPGEGEIKAMAVHPGGEKLFVVMETGELVSSFGDELRKGLVFSDDQYAEAASYPADRISIVALNISNELSHDPEGLPLTPDRSFSDAVTLEGVAYNITDMAISPDGGYALITAMGVSESRATPFGVMPGSDELTGGVFVVDLNTFETVDFLPTAIKGENTREVRKALVTQGNRIKHPVVEVAESNLLSSSGALDVALSGGVTAYSLGGGSAVLTEYLNNSYMAEILSESYQDFGFLAAYASTYPLDMIGATGVGISNRGDIAFVTMERTNNVGVLPISVSTLPSGEQSLDVSTVAFESASPKAINGENIDWSYSNAGAYTNSPYSYWGPADVAFAPDDSVVLVGAYGGGEHRYGTIDLVDKRDVVLSGDPTVNFVALQDSTLTYPKHVAGIPALDNDGDGLSNHVEAFNRWNAFRSIPQGDASALAGAAGGGGLADVNIPAWEQVTSDGSGIVHYLLPHSGVGYRFDYLGQEKFSVNAGNAATVVGIERLGRAWAALDLSVRSGRPYFLVQNIAQPGGGFTFNQSGELVHYTQRYGRDVNLSYFKSGSDEPFDVVDSNDPSSPRDNTISGLDGMDSLATNKLIELLILEPMVKEIWLDPAVAQAYPSHSEKFVLRGSLTDGDSRRDCDSFMKVVFGSASGVDFKVDGIATVYTEKDDGSLSATNYWDAGAVSVEGVAVPVVLSFSAANFDHFTLAEGTELYYDAAGSNLVEFKDASGDLIQYGSQWLSENPVLYLKNTSDSIDLSTYDDLGGLIGEVQFTSTGVGVSLSVSELSFDASYDSFGTPVYADGYNLDQFSPEEVSRDFIDDAADDDGASITGTLTAALTGASVDAYVRISYPSSPPGGVSRYTQLTGGNFTPTYNTYFQLPDSGVLRLWKNGSAQRDLTDYVAPGIYRLSDLGGSLDLFLEAVTDDFVGATIEVSLDPDGDGPAGFVVSDSVTLGDPIATLSSETIAFGETAELTLHATADRYRLVYDSRYLDVGGFAPGYHDSLPETLTVTALQPTDDSGAASIFVELISEPVIGEAQARASGTPGPYNVYEIPVQPGLTRVGSAALTVTGPSIWWSDQVTPTWNLDSFSDGDQWVEDENQTTVKALISPESREENIRYAIAKWEPDHLSGKCNLEPTINEETGLVRSGDLRGELYIFAYDQELPSVQTQTLRITIGYCESCNSGDCIDARGYPTCNLGSINMSIDLGSAGQLLLNAERPSSTLSSPRSLEYPYAAGANLAVYNQSRVLESISGEEVYVTIESESEHKYTINTYLDDDLADHVSRTVIENPDPDAYPNCEHLRISYYDFEGSANPEPRVSEYAFDEDSATWALTEGLNISDGSFERKTTVSTRQSSFSSPVIAGQGMEETRTVIGDNDEVLAKNTVIYIESDLSSLLFEDREHRENADDLVTTYDYYSSGDLKDVKSSDGSWSHQKSDANGRTTQTVEPYGNAEYGTAGADKLITDYGYESVLPQDDLSISPDAPRSVTTTVDGKVISPQSYAYGDGWMVSISGDPADPLLSSKTTTYYVTDDTVFKGRVRRVVHPDGTETHYAYDESRNTYGAITDEIWEVWSGVPNGDSIVDGTYSYRHTDRKGQTLDSFTQDIEFGITIQSQQATAFDDFDRVIEWTYLDGRTTSRAYGCCGVQWEKDRLGIITDYTYDALKRVETMTRLGITTTYHYDKLGRQVYVTQTGTEGGMITQSNLAYVDASGMEYSSFDPLNRETSSTTVYNADGTSTQTTTLPGGATQVQTYDRSGQLVSTSGTAASPVTYENRIETLNGAVYSVQKIIRGSTSTGTEWVEQWSDLLGRNVRTVFPDGAVATQHYNAKGQLARSVDADGVTTLYAYNDFGQQTLIAVDADRDGVIDQNGDVSDSVTETDREYTSISMDSVTYDIMRTTTTVYTETGSIELSVSESSLDGLHSWSTQGEATASRQVVYPATPDGSYEVHSFAADDSYQVQLYVNGRLENSAAYAADDTLIQSVSFGYDQFGRQNEVTQFRYAASPAEGEPASLVGSTTTYTYFDDGQVDTITAPDPEQDVGDLETSHIYDNRGLLATRILPDLSTVHYEYNARGQMEKTYGSQTYPVKYEYDSQARLKTMTTWQDFAGQTDAAVTEWIYDPQRGWLDKKYDADHKYVDYDYTPAGRLKARTWSRGISTTYEYNNAGQLASTDYSDDTPDIAYDYYRYGQIKEVRDGVLTSGAISDSNLRYRHSYTYDSYLRPLTEQIQTLGDLTLTRSYESSGAGQVPGRYKGYTLTESGQTPVLTAATYGYDTAGRLQHVAPVDPAVTTDSQLLASNSLYTYVYRTDSSLIDRIEAPAHTALYDYQPRGNQVRSLINHTADPSSLPSDFTTQTSNFDAVVNRHDYRYNKLGQRKDVTQSGTAYALDVASPTASGSVFDYTYNAKGEVTAADRYEGIDPDSLTTAITNDTFAYTFDDIGNRETSTSFQPAADAPATTIYEADSLNQYTDIQVSGISSQPSYDQDGNLAQDSNYSYTWNGENRLVSITPLNPQNGDTKLSFTYDYQGRRVSKTVETFDSQSDIWLPSFELCFSYDGWNLIAEFKLQASNFTLQTSYLWGLDLSGTLQGAGGVGGLLQVTASTGSTYSPYYDANGNTVGYFDNSTSDVVAHYEFGPFGELIRATGSKKDEFNFRFSTKYEDAETGLLYYGFRYYDPMTGRWLRRDPIGENGGLNLYGMVGNNPASFVDLLGLALYAFDGTNNDGGRDSKKGSETNVYILQSIYEGNRSYLEGVGTNDGLLNPLGLAFGAGGQTRVKNMLAAAKGFIEGGDTVADIIGFSRGAAQARDFANKLKEEFPCVEIRWIGLFDTVASVGLPNDVNLDYELGIPEGTGSVFQLTAGSERRKTTFALSSINAGPNVPNPNPNYREEEIADAVHSDIGGGYGKNRGLGNQALRRMWSDGRANGVPFRDLPSGYGNLAPNGPNDSRWINDKFIELITRKKRERKIYYHP
jgi:RHS repeat-associated protein